MTGAIDGGRHSEATRDGEGLKLGDIGFSGVLTGEKSLTWTWSDNKGVCRDFVDTPVAMARKAVWGALEEMETQGLGSELSFLEELEDEGASRVLTTAREMRERVPKHMGNNWPGVDRQGRVMLAMVGEVVRWLLGLFCREVRDVLKKRRVKTTWEIEQAPQGGVDDEILGWLFRR